MTSYMLGYIEVNKNILDNSLYTHLFTVEEVNRRVLEEGVPFREAYRQVGIEVNEGKFSYRGELHHTHIGSIGNLCNDRISARMSELVSSFPFDTVENALKNLSGR